LIILIILDILFLIILNKIQDFCFSSFSFDKLLNSKYIDIEKIYDEEKQNQITIEALSK